MDTIVTAILVALTTGMASGAAQVGQQAVHEAYNALKSAIYKRYGDKSSLSKSISDLEQEPDFKPYQDAFSERVKKFEPYNDPELHKLAEELLRTLQEHVPDPLGSKTKYQIDIKGGQVGVIGDHTEISGGIHFGDQDRNS